LSVAKAPLNAFSEGPWRVRKKIEIKYETPNKGHNCLCIKFLIMQSTSTGNLTHICKAALAGNLSCKRYTTLIDHEWPSLAHICLLLPYTTPKEPR
jgi:hypothetical protein